MNGILDGNQRRASPTQREVIDAAIRLLERLQDAASGHVTVPDESNRQTPDIDALVEIGEAPFAIEHTRIEQFEEATKEQAFIAQQEPLLAAMQTSLQARLPCGWYELQLHSPINAPKKALTKLFAQLADDVVLVARQLATPAAPGTNIRMGKVTLDRAHIDYRLVRGLDPVDGPNPFLRVVVLRRFPGNDEREARRAVVRRLLADKCAKLKPYRDDGCTTVLVLEDTAFMASPYLLLPLAGAEVRDHHAGATDILIVMNCETDIWSLQFVRTGDALTRELYETNWWIWDPLDHRLIQRSEGTGSRAAMYAAREQARQGR